MTAVDLPSVAIAYHLSSLLTVVVLAGVVAVVLVIVARSFVRSVIEVLTEEPRADVLGEVEAGEWRSIERGITR